MRNKSLVFNLIFITLPAILLTLLTAEVALRTSGYIYSIAIRDSSAKSISQKNSIRILCLGDSFTWGLGALPGKSYPMQLKELLSENCNRPVEVYNAGVPGFTSSLVLKRLNEDINKYNPDFLVIMVGSNNKWNLEDSNYFLLRKRSLNHLNYFERFLSKMKVYKLIKIWYLTIRQKKLYSLTKNTAISIKPDSVTACERGLVLFDKAQYKSAEEYFDKALLLDPHNYIAYMRKAEMLVTRKNYDLAKDALNKAVVLVNYYDIRDINFFYRTLTAVLVNTDEQIRMVRKLKLLTNEYVNDANKKKRFQEILTSQEELLEDVSLYEKILIYDLNQIVVLAQQKNIRVILQTYPCGNNANIAIKKVSQEYALPLVDNERIFREKGKYMNIEELFVSMYDHHCNVRGYRLIAEGIYNVLAHYNYLPKCEKILKNKNSQESD